MKISFRFLASWSLCFIMILGLNLSNGFCRNLFDELRKAAERGDAQAQYYLGEAYYIGSGVPKNLAEAIKWYRKAAEQGHAQAQFALGHSYRTGDGVPQNLSEAAKWWRKSAEQGFADAQFNVGLMYLIGDGVPKKIDEAAIWFRLAAEQGHEKAQYQLGHAYSKGEGVPQSYAQAAKWYRKSAEQGHAGSQFHLAHMYYFGEGVPKDEIEALAWFNVAAANGFQEAAKNRGIIENEIGRQASLLSQQRSKEILKEIESAKQTKTKKEATAQAQPKKPTENAGPKGSGTGVFVADDGLILTAAHVVSKSASLKVFTKQGLKVARVIKVDAANDLALLKCEGSFQATPVKSSSGVKLGQTVFTIGFPNIGLQGFSPKMTKGEINSLSGLQDDPRHWQISVPVQPGNSGGPLFDEAGNLVGVVLSKLDAIKVARHTGDLPQNVNYAVKSIYAMPLLEPYSANLAPEIAASASPKMMESVVERVQGSVVLILVY
jgi:uncharacterized protein